MVVGDWWEAGGDILEEESLEVWVPFISHPQPDPLLASRKLWETTSWDLCYWAPARWG